ncbi:MAG: hypothetical protein HYY06_06805 [Deltaproteobacteria bacterium]|nr:hypothetical protein [Deltaproteobacteria bacterium]
MRTFSLVVVMAVLAGLSAGCGGGGDDDDEGGGSGRGLLGGRGRDDGDDGSQDGHGDQDQGADGSGDDGDDQGGDDGWEGQDGDGGDGWDDQGGDDGDGWDDQGDAGGSNGCLEMLACAAGCADDPCVEACLDAGTADGQAALFDLIDCYEQSCAGVADDEIDPCLEAECPAELEACS